MKNKKILFTGITGLLGRYFVRNIPDNYHIYGTYLKNSYRYQDIKNLDYIKLNVTQNSEIEKQLDNIKPDVILHAASLGNVDYCENNKDEARKVNIKGTSDLLSYAAKYSIPFVFTSTNAVYDGNNGPYYEESNRKPLDYYGYTKMFSENEIKTSGIGYIIIRLMTMYGWNNPEERSNPATWIINQLRNSKKTYVVNDIFNNYLYAGQAADVIWEILKTEKYGETYNLAGNDCISRFEFAKKISAVFGFDDRLLEPVLSDFFPSITPRPKNTCFNTKKVQKFLHINLLNSESGLRLMKNEEH